MGRMSEAYMRGAAPMEGRGGYNANSALQAAGGAVGVPLIEEAAASIAIAESDRPIVLADYGSSEGRNSLAPLSAAVRVLRRRFGPDRAIIVAHTDLPGNDFSTLFEVVDSSAESYARDDKKVFPSAIGRSFFLPVLPPGHVDLGWSSYAAQWLSQNPAPLPGHIFARAATGEAAVAFARQARKDWETFVTLRAEELRRGGRLVVIMPAPNEAGLHPTAVLFDCAGDVLQEMIVEGAITAQERERMIVLSYPRSPEELLAPFGPEGQFAGLKPIHCAQIPIGDIAWTQYERDRDAAALADRRAAFFRATFAPSLARALDSAFEEKARTTFLVRLEAGVRRRLLECFGPSGNFVAKLLLEKA
jgi:hypothetical protein